MLTTIMKWIAITALLLALFWQVFAEHGTLLRLAVCAGAIVTFAEAARVGKYIWIGVFLVVAALFNPVLPVALPPVVLLALNATTLILFLLSLHVLKTKPRLSIASITDRTPGSESL